MPDRRFFARSEKPRDNNSAVDTWSMLWSQVILQSACFEVELPDFVRLLFTGLCSPPFHWSKPQTGVSRTPWICWWCWAETGVCKICWWKPVAESFQFRIPTPLVHHIMLVSYASIVILILPLWNFSVVNAFCIPLVVRPMRCFATYSVPTRMSRQ